MSRTRHGDGGSRRHDRHLTVEGHLVHPMNEDQQHKRRFPMWCAAAGGLGIALAYKLSASHSMRAWNLGPWLAIWWRIHPKGCVLEGVKTASDLMSG
jgi:hypothetical protein